MSSEVTHREAKLYVESYRNTASSVPLHGDDQFVLGMWTDHEELVDAKNGKASPRILPVIVSTLRLAATIAGVVSSVVAIYKTAWPPIVPHGKKGEREELELSILP